MSAPPLLDGLRVVDLSQYIPGPFATRQLADLGADVIKIEPPGGDPMRRFMANDAGDTSAIYRHLNRGKRVCRLDLKQETDKRVFAELLRGADILLESFRPGVLERLGFPRERLDELNPRLIHCALSGFGQTGPWARRAGHDINYCAVAGQSIVSGTAEQPVIAYPPIADHAGALQAAVAMLAALHGRERRSRGVFLDISITESILSWQYLTALQRPDWIERQFEPMPQSGLIDAVGTAIAARNGSDWHALLDAIDCCYAPLLDPLKLADSHYFRAFGFDPESGPGYPGRIDGDRFTMAASPAEIPEPNLLYWRDSAGAGS